MRIANPFDTGGGSEGTGKGELELARVSTKPVYTIDADRIYRLDPNYSGRHTFNPDQWFRNPSGCASKLN